MEGTNNEPEPGNSNERKRSRSGEEDGVGDETFSRSMLTNTSMASPVLTRRRLNAYREGDEEDDSFIEGEVIGATASAMDIVSLVPNTNSMSTDMSTKANELYIEDEISNIRRATGIISNNRKSNKQTGVPPPNYEQDVLLEEDAPNGNADENVGFTEIRGEIRSLLSGFEEKIMDSLKKADDLNQRKINAIANKMDRCEQRQDTLAEEVNRIETLVQSNMTRTEEAIEQIRAQRLDTEIQEAIQRDDALMAPLLERIRILENNQKEQQKALDLVNDSYYSNTLEVKILIGDIPQRPSTRAVLRAVLETVGCEGIVGSVERISINRNKKTLRLTFQNKQAMNDCGYHLGGALAQIRRNGSDPGLAFYRIIPPRLFPQKAALAEIARRMKSNGSIRNYEYIILGGVLKLKTKRGDGSTEVIDAPTDNNREEVINSDEEVMDQDPPQSENLQTDVCHICFGSYSEGVIVEYGCGHRFHEPCLRTVLCETLNCPTCREPPLFGTTFDCDECEMFLEENSHLMDTMQDCLPRGCQHLHLKMCQERFREEHLSNFPLSVEGYNALKEANPSACRSCMFTPQVPQSNISSWYKIILYTEGMTGYNRNNANNRMRGRTVNNTDLNSQFDRRQASLARSRDSRSREASQNRRSSNQRRGQERGQTGNTGRNDPQRQRSATPRSRRQGGRGLAGSRNGDRNRHSVNSDNNNRGMIGSNRGSRRRGLY